MLRFMRYLSSDDDIIVDEEVARSEAETGFRNMALANYMRAFGNIRHPVEQVLGTYFHQCAIEMTCVQLAKAGRFLMLGGQHPEGGQVVSERRARRINALMLTCGHYDASGDFAFRVGLPGKSGVGGGILAIAPGKAAIAVWSPGLNANGNSLLGTLALERLTEATGRSIPLTRLVMGYQFPDGHAIGGPVRLAGSVRLGFGSTVAIEYTAPSCPALNCLVSECDLVGFCKF